MNFFVNCRKTALFLCLLIVVSLVLPQTAIAENEDKTVKVGWFESGFNIIDEYGRRSGYAYEYQRKIAAYTGWKYEYVEGSWPDLLQMLKEGKIDMLGDVSYVEERTKDILYSSIPMGTESYFLFVPADSTEITAKDYKSLSGKKIGVSSGTYQEKLIREWVAGHDLEVEVLGLEGADNEAMQELFDGNIDAYVTLDSYGNPERIKPVWKIGSSDFYFAVNKSKPELLDELDSALNMIQDEDMYYNQNLYDRYLGRSGTEVYLSVSEKEWLEKHGKIRIGYQDNYLAFCSKDPETGELIGALKDFLGYVSKEMKNAEIVFEPVAYQTVSEAIAAMKAGEVDCVFPANLTAYDGETLGLVMTPALMRTEMDAVVRISDQKTFLKQEKTIVTVNKGNTNYEMFLVDHFPNWEKKYYDDTMSCLDAIASGEADCILISNYRYSNISKKCEKLHLTTVYSGVDMDYSFAVSEGNMELYSIMSKATTMVPVSILNAALTFYSTEDVKIGFFDLIKEHLLYILAAGFFVLLVILILVLRGIRLERRAREEHTKVADLNRKVFVDALTSVRNKGGFDAYVAKLQERLDQSEEFTYAIGMIDCDNLKKINDQYGHEKGDIYLKTASRLICNVFQHSPVFRIGGDEFAVILEGEDFNNMDRLVEEFETRQAEISSAAENEWEETHISIGIAVHDPETDNSVSDTVSRADKVMYDHKRAGKRLRID